MKNIQISEELFFALLKYHLVEMDDVLPEMDMQPNILTRKLNIGMERLFMDYGIRYESKRGHSSRMIKLTLEQRA